MSVTVEISKKGKVISRFEIDERDVNTWIHFASSGGFGIKLYPTN